MARTTPSELPAIALSLRQARKAAKFTNAKTLLAAVYASEGKAPSYSTYAQWESGEVSPRDESLAPVVEFHRKNGTWEPVDDAPDLATALLALARELAAAREERASLRAELDDLHELVGRLAQERLTGPAPEGSREPHARPRTAGSDR